MHSKMHSLFIRGERNLKISTLYANLHTFSGYLNLTNKIMYLDICISHQQIKNLCCDTLYLFPPLTFKNTWYLYYLDNPTISQRPGFIIDYSIPNHSLQSKYCNCCQEQVQYKTDIKTFSYLDIGRQQMDIQNNEYLVFELCTCQLHLTDSDTFLSSKFK